MITLEIVKSALTFFSPQQISIALEIPLCSNSKKMQFRFISNVLSMLQKPKESHLYSGHELQKLLLHIFG